MRENIAEKEITNNELLRYITEQFDKVFAILDTKAGKDDLNKLDIKLSKEIANVREEMRETKMELKADISELRVELKSDLVDLKDELKGDIQSLRKDTNHRFFALKSV